MKSRFFVRYWTALFLFYILLTSVGCSLDLSVKDLLSKGTASEESNFSRSVVKIIPEVSEVPLNAEVKVQYLDNCSGGSQSIA